MNVLERNYYNAFVGVRNFGADNVVDFKAGSAGANKFAAVGAAALEMEQSGAVQISGVSGQMTMQKDVAIAEVCEICGRSTGRRGLWRLTIALSASFS